MKRTIIAVISIVVSTRQLYCLAATATNATPQAVSMATYAADRVDVVTQSGQVYTNCAIVRIDPDGITVSSSNGIAKIAFADLSDDYRKKYKYNSPKAEEHTGITSQKEAAGLAGQPEPAQHIPESAHYEAVNKESIDAIEKTAIELVGTVQQKTADGAFITDAMMPAAYQEEVVKLGYKPTEKNRKFETKIEHVPVNKNGEPVFIIGGGSGFTEGGGWNATVYPAGTYKYTTASGEQSIVKCYALSPEAALNKMTLRSR